MLLAFVASALGAETRHVTLTAKDGVTTAQVAAATTPIEVGTFEHDGRTFSVECKGSGRNFTCNALGNFAKGVAKVGLGVASVRSEIVADMAAMNMQFVVHLPSSVVPDAAAILPR